MLRYSPTSSNPHGLVFTGEEADIKYSKKNINKTIISVPIGVVILADEQLDTVKPNENF